LNLRIFSTFEIGIHRRFMKNLEEILVQHFIIHSLRIISMRISYVGVHSFAIKLNECAFGDALNYSKVFSFNNQPCLVLGLSL
jgi:hypothetical protein